MRAVAVLLGLAFAAVAILYWAMPAGSLPSFLPGFEVGSNVVHVKHGIAAAAVSVLFLALGWYAGRARA